jgi:hypothetical protein
MPLALARAFPTEAPATTNRPNRIWRDAVPFDSHQCSVIALIARRRKERQLFYHTKWQIHNRCPEDLRLRPGKDPTVMSPNPGRP